MRRLLLGLAACAALSALPTSSVAAPGEPVPTDRDCLRFTHGIDLQTVTIPQLEQAMNAGKITSGQLVDAYLARIKAYDTFNAIRAPNPHARDVAARYDRER